MNINAETKLVNELIRVQEQIEFCFDQKNWAQVEQIDDHCRDVLEQVNEFAKSGSSMLLKLQVEALIRSYRELLTQSIFEQKSLQDQHDELSTFKENVLFSSDQLQAQVSVQ